MPLHPDDEPGFHEGIWDADPDVCCAAYQLGACVHTEAYIHELLEEQARDSS